VYKEAETNNMIIKQTPLKNVKISTSLHYVTPVGNKHGCTRFSLPKSSQSRICIGSYGLSRNPRLVVCSLTLFTVTNLVTNKH